MFISDKRIINTSMTMGVKIPNAAQEVRVLNFVTLNAFASYGARRQAACEELKARTVHRDRY